MFQVNQTRRPALEHRRRLPEARRSSGRTSRCVTGAHGPRARARRRPRGRRAMRHGRGRERSIRAEREVILSRGRDRLAAAAAAVRHRRGRRPARGRRGGAPRAPGRRAQPPGPPVRHACIWEVTDQDTLYGADKPKPLAEWVLRRTGPLTSTVAEVVRVRAHPPGTAGRRHPVPHGRRLLRRPRRGDLRRALRGHRARARVTEGPRPGLAALGRSDRQAAHHHQQRCPSPTTCDSLVGGVQLAREIATQAPLREIIVEELKPGPDRPRTTTRSRGRPAAAPDADLPPGRHVPHERRGRGRGRRLPTARPRHRGPARRGRVGHARHPGRQHQRPDDHDRRAGRRPDPRDACEHGRDGDGSPDCKRSWRGWSGATMCGPTRARC